MASEIFECEAGVLELETIRLGSLWVNFFMNGKAEAY